MDLHVATGQVDLHGPVLRIDEHGQPGAVCEVVSALATEVRQPVGWGSDSDGGPGTSSKLPMS